MTVGTNEWKPQVKIVQLTDRNFCAQQFPEATCKIFGRLLLLAIDSIVMAIVELVVAEVW